MKNCLKLTNGVRTRGLKITGEKTCGDKINGDKTVIKNYKLYQLKNFLPAGLRIKGLKIPGHTKKSQKVQTKFNDYFGKTPLCCQSGIPP